MTCLEQNNKNLHDYLSFKTMALFHFVDITKVYDIRLQCTIWGIRVKEHFCATHIAASNIRLVIKMGINWLVQLSFDTAPVLYISDSLTWTIIRICPYMTVWVVQRHKSRSVESFYGEMDYYGYGVTKKTIKHGLLICVELAAWWKSET